MKTFYRVAGILTVISGVLAGISVMIVGEGEIAFVFYGLLTILAGVLNALPFFTLADLLGRTEALEWEAWKNKHPAPNTITTDTSSAPSSGSLKDALDW